MTDMCQETGDNMKKILLSLLCFVVFFMNNIFAEKATTVIEVFKSDKVVEKIWYLEKNANFYMAVGYDGILEAQLFKFENNKFIEIIKKQEEVRKFISKYEVSEIDDPKNEKIDIGDNKYLVLKRIGDSYTDYFLNIEDNGREKDISKNRYALYSFGSYAYIDKTYQKIYMFAKDFKKKKRGLFVYNIKDDVFSEMYTVGLDNYDVPVYSNPIRIPNTQYLMYRFTKNKNNWSIYIEEIPEWKEGIEAQNKEKAANKVESKEEVKYIIDGPANLRDKAKSKKIIGSIEDKSEVKILNKKGDWYEVQSGDIKGWTFKDNVKEVK